LVFVEACKLLLFIGRVDPNFFLFVIQLYAAVTTGSLALFATAADAFMDLVSSYFAAVLGFVFGFEALFFARAEEALDHFVLVFVEATQPSPRDL
jgi:hypothetical protein